MATARLFDALPDFGTRSRGSVALHSAASASRASAGTPEPDLSERIRLEVARAEQALEKRLAERHEAELAAERERLEAELETRTRQLGEQAGQAISSRLAHAQAELLGHVTATVARILGGVLAGELQKRSIESLAASLRAALGDNELMRMEVRGPQSLFEALAAALPDRAGNLHFIESENFDLTVTVEGMLFETRLGEWSAALSEILK